MATWVLLSKFVPSKITPKLPSPIFLPTTLLLLDAIAGYEAEPVVSSVEGMRTVNRETGRELSCGREGRRTSPATTSLVKIGQMIACGNVWYWRRVEGRASSGAAVMAEKAAAAAVCGEMVVR
jgi:hypothetical protein